MIFLGVVLMGSPRVAAEAVRVELSGGQNPLVLEATVNHQAIDFGRDNLAVRDGLSLRRNPASTCFSLKGGETETAVEVHGFPGWIASLPPHAQLLLCLRPDPHQLDLVVSDGSAASVRFQLPDGARAEARPGARLRFDQFRDESYTLSGRGSIDAENSDGAKVILSENQPPLTGGPLVTRSDKGQRHLERQVPTIEATISGVIGNSLSLQIGERKWTIQPRGKLAVDLPNGSALSFQQDLAAYALRWQVAKGDVRLSIEQIPGWKAIARSGDSGAMIWDGASRSIDLKNTGPEAGLVVSLPNDCWARVDPRATFQFTHVNFSAFATAAFGGAVRLWNSRTTEETDLVPANLLFQTGKVIPKTIASVVAENKISLFWRNGGALSVHGVFGLHQLTAGTSQVLTDKEARELEVSYSSRELVTVTARAGAFEIDPEPIPHWRCVVPEGNSVNFLLGRAGASFTIRAGADNLSPLEVKSPEGQTAMLSPGSALNFSSPSGSLADNPQGAVVFFTGEGSGQQGSFGLAPGEPSQIGIRASGFDEFLDLIEVPRISQPPVTSVR